MTDLAEAQAPQMHDLGVVTDLADSFVELMRNFVRNRQAMMQAAEHDVEWTSHVVLRCLRSQGPIRAGGIAEFLQADPSTVSRQVAALVKEGLVERRADPDDGRASLLVLTPAADGVLAEYDDLRARYFADMLADWTQRDVHQFADYLERFSASYKSMSDELVINKARQISQARLNRTTGTATQAHHQSNTHHAGSTN